VVWELGAFQILISSHVPAPTSVAVSERNWGGRMGVEERRERKREGKKKEGFRSGGEEAGKVESREARK
jgi:hypothetical protein